MNFNVTIDKKVQAEIDAALCINCGRCREFCPTGAIDEYQKTVSCIFADCGAGKGAASPVRYAEETAAFSAKCACSAGCPLGIVPQAVAALVKDGELERAYDYIDERNPLPWVCSEVCDHFCHDLCKRGSLVDEPVNMQALEGYILSRTTPKRRSYVDRGKEKIAVIGGGPAGITAGFELSKAGYSVTIFEKDHQLGGALSWGIPAFRLDKDKLRQEIDRVVSTAIEVEYRCHIGENVSLDQIWERGYSACLIAVGASCGRKPDLPGVEGTMVYDAVSVLRGLNGAAEEQREVLPLGEKIVVVGGGGSAADTARLLARMGKEVLCAAMEAPDALQISDQQVETMREEGIDFRTLMAPKQIIREGDKVKAVEFVRTESIEDERGRMRMHTIKGSEYNVFCDTVIFAVGQKSCVERISKVETWPDGRVKVDSRHRTNKRMIFACGDVTGESASVVEAMAAGRRAAAEISDALCGRQLSEEEHRIFNAPAGETIYPENIQTIRPQYRQRLLEGQPEKGCEPVDDILPMLRSAGIEETMPAFTGMTRAKVAIAGGGIAGITAAIALAKKGYRPTIFEKYSVLGGSYRMLTTNRRIDKKLLVRELEKVEASGIEVVYNASVGIRPSLAELKRAGYEAVLFAIGETVGRKPQMANVDCPGVFDLITLMGRLADHEVISGVGDQVLVLGSDEMTFDAARWLRKHCRQVTVVAGCSRGGLQVTTSAVNIALEEGVNIVTGVELSRINAADGTLQSIDCKILENNLSMNIPCDTLVLGNTAVADTETIAVRNPDLALDETGGLAIDDKLATSVAGVFAIGNYSMSSPDAGRAGAAAIDNFLEDGGMAISVVDDSKEVAVTHEIIEGHLEKRTGIETGRRVFDDMQALTEASRCMGCGYHRETAERCMGCGICARICPVNAVRLVAADGNTEGGWPSAREIENFVDRKTGFGQEVK